MSSRTSWSAIAELAADQHGVFTRAQAADHGISPYRLRSAAARGEIRKTVGSVCAFTSHARSWRQRLMVLSLNGLVISHRAAAALLGLDGFTEGKLEVTSVRDTNYIALPRLVSAHTTTELHCVDIVEVDAIACTSAAHTLVDLGQVVSNKRLGIAVDSALRQGLTMAELDETLERLSRPGRTGVGPLRRLLADPERQGALPDSMFERLVEQMVAAHGIPAPTRQYPVEIAGRFVRRVDLAWPLERVAVEAHSKRWHFGARAEADDNQRDLELAAAGWEVLYITWQMAKQPEFFIQQLQAVLARRRPASA